MKRSAEITRKTRETDITVDLNVDGSGKGIVQSGIGFFDHLLDALKKHAYFDLDLRAKGDLHIDGHHTVEDIGIVVGQAFDKALNDRKGIERFGCAFCPLDEALARSVVDVSGRGFLVFECDLQFGTIGVFEGALFEEFLRAFATNARLTLHVCLLAGKNQHHALEAMMKSMAVALRKAVAFNIRQKGIASTKGVLV